MAKGNILDRMISAVAPVHAAKRAAARGALSILNSGYGNYGANLTKKSLRGWEYHGGSAKEDIEDNLDVLRQRSRDAYMGIPTATAALKTLRTNVVAGGLIPSPQIDGEFLGLSQEETEKLQEQIVREFALWADKPTCDAERVDNFYQLQQLAFLSYLMNGDTMALLPVKKMAGQPYDLRVRLIEGDRVCSPDGFDRLAPCTVQGHKVHHIVQGVETDRDGMVVAYWVCNRHPLGSHSAAEAEGITWARVEAYGASTGRRNVLHVMNRERVGQRRGVPILAPVLESLKQLGRYTEAEITAAVISAMFTVFIKSESPADGRPFGAMIPAAELIADDFCQPIYEEWMAEAVARGRIQATGFFADPAVRKAYTDCAWNGPARTNLNPVQEVTAATKRVEACFSTAQEETAQMTGGDYNRNVRQRAIEVRRKREVDEIANPPQPAAPAPGQEPPPGKGKEGQGGEGNA